MKISAIDVIPINAPLAPEIAPHLYRSNHPARLTLYRVELAGGAVGWGEVAGEPEDVSAFVGVDALAGLNAIAHGGVQMACFDAVGHALGLPAHRLMGRQARQRVPFAWWSNDLPPEVFADQVQQAAAAGFRVYKFKCRPWWDPIEQVAAAAAVAPPGFELWLDFNGHLREARLALPILRRLAEFDCVGGFESPIPQRDAAGYAELRTRIERPIAAHYGSGCCHVRSDSGYDRGVPALQQIEQRLCDGFVFGGDDVTQIRERAAVALEAHIPFWLQTVGGALRAAWIVQIVSTFRAGTLAHLATHNVFAEDVVDGPQPVAGLVDVPDSPGLGVPVDEARVARLRAAPEVERPRRLTTVVYADGSRWHFADEIQRHETFHFGHLPGFRPGVRLALQEDDGSSDFDDLFRRAGVAPVRE